jgi:hypothetical protein
LMPFSRSQNSITARNSAFIFSVFPVWGTKKSAELSPTRVALATQQ